MKSTAGSIGIEGRIRIVPLSYVRQMPSELADRVQVAFDGCKAFPEAGKQGAFFMVRGDAYMALLELRNMCPGIVLALDED